MSYLQSQASLPLFEDQVELNRKNNLKAITLILIENNYVFTVHTPDNSLKHNSIYVYTDIKQINNNINSGNLCFKITYKGVEAFISSFGDKQSVNVTLKDIDLLISRKLKLTTATNLKPCKIG